MHSESAVHSEQVLDIGRVQMQDGKTSLSDDNSGNAVPHSPFDDVQIPAFRAALAPPYFSIITHQMKRVSSDFFILQKLSKL